MKVNSRFAGLIIATGDKTNHMQVDPLKKTGNIPILKRMVANMQAAGAYPIVMITGRNAWEVERSLPETGVIFIRAEDYKDLTTLQMIQGGCTYLQGKHKIIIAVSVEFPFYQSETVKGLSQVKCRAGLLTCHGKPSFPVIIASDFIQKIQESEGEADTLKFFMEQPGVAVAETEDEGILYRTEETGALPKALAARGSQMFHPYIRSEIGGEGQIFDPRLKVFLHLLDETNSLKTASAHSALSVEKAWEIFDLLEEILGYPVVEGDRDDSPERNEDLAELTAAGGNFFSQYEKYERQLYQYAERTFNELFHGR